MEQEQQGGGTGGRIGAVWGRKEGEERIEEDVVGEEDEERGGQKNGEEAEEWVELVVEEELEGRETGEWEGKELVLYLLEWQEKRVIEESAGKGRRGQSIEDWGEGKETVVGGMDEIGGG